MIDPKTCIQCGECVRACGPGAIDLDTKEERETIEVVHFLLGVGFEPFWGPEEGGIRVWPIRKCVDEHPV